MLFAMFEPNYFSSVLDIIHILKRGPINISAFSADATDRLSLDAQPITKRSVNELKKINCGSFAQRIQLNAEEGFRIALAAGFERYVSLIWSLKQDFERFLVMYNHVDYSVTDPDASMADAAARLDDDFCFVFDVKSIYKNYFNDLPRDRFNLLVDHIMNLKAFYYSIYSREMEHLSGYIERIASALAQAGDHKVRSFQYSLYNWHEMLLENARLLLQLKDSEVSTSQLIHRAMARFGRAFHQQLFKKEELDRQLYEIKQKIEIKSENPQLTKRQISTAISSSKAKDSEYMEKLKILGERAVARGMKPFDFEGIVSSPIDAKKAEKLRTMTMRKIALLNPILHQHICSAQQEEWYREKFERAIELKNMSFGDDPRLVRAHEIAQKELDNILEDVQFMYNFGGCSLPTHLMVHGSGLDEMIAYMEGRKKIIEREMEKTEAQINNLYDNMVYKACSVALQFDGSKTELIRQLELQVKVVEREKLRLVNQYEALFISAN